MALRSLPLVLWCLLVGLGAVSAEAQPAAPAALREGMTEAEVAATFGPPMATLYDNKGFLHYRYPDDVMIEFVDGKVFRWENGERLLPKGARATAQQLAERTKREQQREETRRAAAERASAKAAASEARGQAGTAEAGDGSEEDFEGDRDWYSLEAPEEETWEDMLLRRSIMFAGAFVAGLFALAAGFQFTGFPFLWRQVALIDLIAVAAMELLDVVVGAAGLEMLVDARLRGVFHGALLTVLITTMSDAKSFPKALSIAGGAAFITFFAKIGLFMLALYLVSNGGGGEVGP